LVTLSLVREEPRAKRINSWLVENGWRTIMTTRREFLTTGASLVASGAVLTEGLTSCTAPAVQLSDKTKLVDDTQVFIELSALLTGLNDLLLSDRDLNDAMAREYARRLRGTFHNEFPALLTAYKNLGAVDSTPKDDALLKRLRATPEFNKNEIVARQIVNIWYFSQFNDRTNTVIDGGFYERGLCLALDQIPADWILEQAAWLLGG